MLIWETWQNNAKIIGNHDAIIHWETGNTPYRYTWKSLWQSALYFSRELKTRVVAPGDVCALILRHNRLFYPVYMGVMLEGMVGEIVVRSVSLFMGYKNNPLKTKEVLRDGWFYTGDLGIKFQGEFYVSGRKKDLIISAGRNLFPEDIEAVVSKVPGVVPGRVVAFGIFDERVGTEKVCVVPETRDNEQISPSVIEMGIKKAGSDIDVTIAAVYLVPHRWLIKSSCGKPSRGANEFRVLQEFNKPFGGNHD